MPRSFGEPLTKLRVVPIRENGEPLVDPRMLSNRIVFAEKHPAFPEMKCVPNIRRRVAEMLAQAAESLPVGVAIQIVEGFRPLAQQRFMYEHTMARFAKEHPEWNKSTLHRITNTMSAPPDDLCPPPHSTGGAVDLGLIRQKTGEVLDMTSPFEWDEKSAPTILRDLAPQAQANRDLLIKTLEATGLTNYAGEWWHWSYGDSGWALRSGAQFALYGPVSAPNSP